MSFFNKEKKENAQFDENGHIIHEEKTPEQKRKQWVGRIAILAVFIIAVAVYALNPAVHSAVNAIIDMFKSGDFDRMHAFIAKYGKWAMLVSTLLMVFQSIAAPLPAFFITLTNANLFGWFQGMLLSWFSSMLGAVMCFYIARILGRDVVEKICTKGALLQIEDFFARYGKRCILIARLLPFISFDVVSYAAGLTAMDFWGFFWASAIGEFPATLVYSYVGGMLTGGTRMLFMALVCLFALAILVVMIRQIFAASDKKKKEAAEKAGVEYVAEGANPAKVVSKFYNAALWGMIGGLVCAMFPSLTSSWNVGWALYGIWFLCFVILICIRKLNCGIKFTLINTVVSIAAIVIMCGSALTRKPAGLVRMGLGMSRVPIDTFNIAIIVFVIVGLLLSVGLWILRNKKKAA